jgi:hypothetical protein
VRILLDVMLGGETAFPISDILALTGTPFIFVTGHPASARPVNYRHRPVMLKPCGPRVLMALIGQILGETDPA